MPPVATVRIIPKISPKYQRITNNLSKQISILCKNSIILQHKSKCKNAGGKSKALPMGIADKAKFA